MAEEIANSCKALAEKLCADATARTDVKLALIDVLDEALQGKQNYFLSQFMIHFSDVMEYDFQLS